MGLRFEGDVKRAQIKTISLIINESFIKGKLRKLHYQIQAFAINYWMWKSEVVLVIKNLFSFEADAFTLLKRVYVPLKVMNNYMSFANSESHADFKVLNIGA